MFTDINALQKHIRRLRHLKVLIYSSTGFCFVKWWVNQRQSVHPSWSTKRWLGKVFEHDLDDEDKAKSCIGLVPQNLIV